MFHFEPKSHRALWTGIDVKPARVMPNESAIEVTAIENSLDSFGISIETI